MHTVVDAMNVIGSRPDGWWRDRPAALARLHAALERWATTDGAPSRVTLVLEHEPEPALPAGRVAVAWASEPGPDAADREILRRLPAWLQADEVTVVSSDRDLADRARAAGATVIGAAAFRRSLPDP